MPHDLNRLECQADFTYTMNLNVVKIQDTGRGLKAVAEDLEAVLRKIEDWHQGSIAVFVISYRDAQGTWHQLSSRRQGSDSRSSLIAPLKNKICRDCHKRKPLTEYYRGDSYADGHYTRCKACCAEVRRRRYLESRERVLEQQRAHYDAHRKRICTAREEYRKIHREYTREYAREYYWRNRKRMLESGRGYCAARKAQSTTRHTTVSWISEKINC
jgi:hypothetical protein